jgi:hypothetical protein
MDHHDIAQICLNGHCINSAYNKLPQFNQDFCDKCGEKTITQCTECGVNILGDYENGVMAIGFEFHSPEYCHNCGKPFPWLAKKIKAAIEMAELE